jgi:putative Mg2+ transporter-C (MgtC) family protein
MPTEVLDILMRLVAAGLLGACIGFERRIHHKAIGIAGMVLIAIGSTTYMLLGRHLAELDDVADALARAAPKGGLALVVEELA